MSNVLAILLGTGRAWRAAIGTYFRDFLDAIIASCFDPVREVAFKIFTNILVNDTETLDLLEDQYALFGDLPTEEERRARLLAAIQATGGTGIEYMEGVLRTAGFDITIHNGYVSPGVYLDPRAYLLNNVYVNYDVTMGRPTSIMNGDDQQIMGRTTDQLGYVLTVKGQPNDIPADSTRWPYFIYIGGENFGDFVQIDANRRDEFERLARQVTPGHLWLGFFVEFI